MIHIKKEKKKKRGLGMQPVAYKRYLPICKGQIVFSHFHTESVRKTSVLIHFPAAFFVRNTPKESV